MSYNEIPLGKAHRLINTGATVLVTSRSGDKNNVMVAAWQMPISFKPPLIAVGIGKARYTHKLIEESGEFIVNVPPVEMLNTVWYCGTHSGKNLDKFSLCALNKIKAKKVKAPAIEGCIGFIECRVYSSPSAGDHTIFVGEILSASAKEGLFDEVLNLEKAQPVHHLGDRFFCTTNATKEVK